MYVRVISILRKLVLALMVVFALATGVLAPGCTQNGNVETRDRMLMRAEDVIMEGRNLKEKGLAANDDTMASKGEQMIQEGQKQKQEALKGHDPGAM